MATEKLFGDMLNEYLTYDILKSGLLQRDYLLNRVDKDSGWKGGNLVVPFKGAGASSVAFGEMVAADNISSDKYVRGNIAGYKELWGTMSFLHKDLMEHDSGIKEKSFLKLLPDAIDDFLDLMKMSVSINLLNGAHFATLTGNGTVGGLITVDRPDRFMLGQELFLKDGNTALSAAAYVEAIDMNTCVVHLVTARGGAVDFDASAYTVAQAAKCYHRGAATNSFTSLKGALLSYANGGTESLYGCVKTSAPYLQAINIDGTGVSAANILSKLFDAYTTIRSRSAGNPNEIICSYKHLGSILKLLESSKGSFNVEPGSMKASVYGWTEVTIGGVKGSLKIVAIQECDDSEILFMDWKNTVKFFSNGQMFRKRSAPDGKQFFEIRDATQGFKYLVDISLHGDLVVSKPSACGVMYGIPAY